MCRDLLLEQHLHRPNTQPYGRLFVRCHKLCESNVFSWSEENN